MRLRRRRGVRTVQCTGISASWCPLHGDCVCPRTRPDGDFDDGNANDPSCPLHAPSSEHATYPRAIHVISHRANPQPTERQGDEGVVTVDELLDRLDEIGFPVVGIEPCSIPIGYWTDDAECGWSVSIMGPEVSTPSGRENDGEMFEERTLLSALTLAVEWVDERQGGGS